MGSFEWASIEGVDKKSQSKSTKKKDLTRLTKSKTLSDRLTY